MPPFDIAAFGWIFAGLVFLGLCATVFVQESLYGFNVLIENEIVYPCGNDLRLSSPPPRTWPIFDNYLGNSLGPLVTENTGMKLCVVFVVLLSVLAARFAERKMRDRAVEKEIRERSVVLAAAGVAGAPRANRLPARRGNANDGETRPMTA
jgi:hypothetical protein